MCQNVNVIFFFPLAQPFTAGTARTRHLSPIHRASAVAWAQAGLEARWIGLAIGSIRYPAV